MASDTGSFAARSYLFYEQYQETGDSDYLRDAAGAAAQSAYSGLEFFAFEASFFAGVTPASTVDDAARAAAKTDGKVATRGATANRQLCTGSGCACFVEGTLVATDDGLKPIEDVNPGDLVLARDEVTGELAYKRVVRTFITPNKRVINLYLLTENGIETVGVTDEHPFWVVGKGWVGASMLKPGDELFSLAGGWVRVAGSTWVSGTQTVFNMEVEGFHTYFVGDGRVLVHNNSKANIAAGKNYRGVHAKHPKLAEAKEGKVSPGNVNGKVTRDQHNKFGDDPMIQAESPFTSWTTKRSVAVVHANKHGPGGVVLEVPQAVPPSGATWSWTWSPDKWFESEVLMKGSREGIKVTKP